MCHLILFMPVVALPIFWLMPLSSAIPVYIIIVLISVSLYWLIAKSMRKPIQDGFLSLIGTEAKVVSRLVEDHSTRYLVRSQGELWSAYSTDALQPGEPVNIVAVKGIGVVVRRAENESSQAKTRPGGAKNNERHCH